MGASGGGVSWAAYPILQNAGIILLIIIGIGLLGFLIFIKNRKKGLIQKIKEITQNENIVFSDISANFFGQESKKYKQVKGNGILTITNTSLMFFMLLPKKEIHIELSKIDSIEYPSSFLGKSIFKPLLKVNFIDENGQKDSAAWFVKNIELAKKNLEDKISKYDQSRTTRLEWV
ncbi:MAG: hypothetical protein ABIJ59_20195 [Pseudomonadota bacterium]